MADIVDHFSGDDEALRASIKALIELNDDGALSPHGMGGHARSLLASAYHRLGPRPETAVEKSIREEYERHMDT